MLCEAITSYNRPYDKISDLIKEGSLVALRRGLYIPGPETDSDTPEHFVIANHLRGPSYISLDTALSYWGLIPERVYEIASITLKSTKTYHTPIGKFSFYHQQAPYYTFGIASITLKSNQVALIASKEKALCDKIIYSAGVNLRSVKQTIEYLVEDLRIDIVELQNLDTKKIETWIEDAPKKSSLRML